MPAMRIDTECEKKNKVLAAMKKAGLLFGVLAVFAGCRPEPRAEEDPFIPIGMSAGLELSTKAVAGPIMGDNFPVSTLDVFRLTVYATAGDEPSQYDEAYEGLEDAVVNSTGTEGIFELADGPEYYPADGRELYFYAYAPALQSDYTGGAGSMAPFVTFRLDGTQDILWDTVTRGIGKAATAGNQENPDFTFRHKLMLIEFTAKAADGFQAGNLRVKTVRVKDVNLNAILDLVTGRMSYSSPGDLSVTEENGWEIPTTWSEFTALCEEIQASGMTPLYFGFKDTWTCLSPWNSLAVSLSPADTCAQVNMGNTTFTEEYWDVAEKMTGPNEAINPGKRTGNGIKFKSRNTHTTMKD